MRRGVGRGVHGLAAAGGPRRPRHAAREVPADIAVDKQLTTHFFSPNPSEDGTIRATWQHSRDTSIVWGGQAIASSDPDFVEPGAVPWLLLPMAGVQAGPNGGDTLTATSFIQRLNTSGGVAPSSGCSEPANVGAKAFVPYTADYFFYRSDE